MDYRIDLQVGPDGAQTMLYNGVVIGRSRQPIYDAARYLQGRGISNGVLDTASTYYGNVKTGEGFVVFLANMIWAGPPPPAQVVPVVLPPPVNILLPAILGTVQVGQTLTATAGTWINSPASFTYEWNRGGLPISGATASTYVPVPADIGASLDVIVTATNAFGSSTAASAPTSFVVDIIPTINTAASIPGVPQVGIATTAIDAIWNNSVTSRTYQWKVAGVNATGPGATTLTYTPVVGDIGSTATITVTATNSGGTSAPSTSAPSAVIIASGAATNILLLGLAGGSR